MALLQHCEFCFDVLHASFTKKRIGLPPFADDKFPLFVTWHKKRGKNESLRGCIGTFSEIGLHQGLREYALTRIEESLPLSKQKSSYLAAVCHYLCISNQDSIGTHGILIKFESSGSYSATYLPEVCHEQGWTKEECLRSLIRKSGYEGLIDDALLNKIKLTRYQSSKITMTYDQWQVLKAKEADIPSHSRN